MREALSDRGIRGIIGLAKQFKLMDDNNTSTIDYLEFKKTISDYRLGLEDFEIEMLFGAFDIGGEGIIY